MKNKRLFIAISLLLMIISCALITVYVYIRPFYSLKINKIIEIVKEDNKDITLAININDKYIECSDDNLQYNKTTENKCILETNKSIENIYAKNKHIPIS